MYYLPEIIEMMITEQYRIYTQPSNGRRRSITIMDIRIKNGEPPGCPEAPELRCECPEARKLTEKTIGKCHDPKAGCLPRKIYYAQNPRL